MRTDPEFLEWFNSRPAAVQEAVRKRPGDKLYRMKSTGHKVFICSYDEPVTEEQKGDITVTVAVTAKFNEGLGFERRVFGIQLDDLEEVPA